MFDVVLFQPEIPPNTGNVIRLCANTGAHLHLVKPLGFDLSDKQLARAGLDYHDLARVSVHEDWEALRRQLPGQRMFLLTTRGQVRHDKPTFRAGDVFVFGSETRGVPESIHREIGVEGALRLPMIPANRSINLSNAVAVMVFEAWRQCGFSGAV
ncbi:MAG: tRNA (cytidine(34)-2'-O)-methyltransferase [Zoogloeaceae bacterium]|nr:tRNA (cytidine(34)-2'-O)-methyltransferase [Zoogloeaceae bacterium]